MNTITKTILLGTILTVLFSILFGTCTYFNVQKQWAIHDNAAAAVFERQKVAHDEMWKVIKSKFGLKDDMKEMYFAAVNAYAERGKSYQNTTWVWVQENFPQLNQTGAADFYRELGNTIESQNAKFSSIRNDVVTVTNEFNNFVSDPYNQIFLSSQQEQKRESKIITSAVTNEAARTLEDNLDWQKK